MEIKEFKKYVIDLDEYSAQDVDDFEFMDDEELYEYQQMLERDGGSLSEWDHLSAFITMKKKYMVKDVMQIDDMQEGVFNFKGVSMIEGKRVLLDFKCKVEDFEVNNQPEFASEDYPRGYRVPREMLLSRDVNINIKPVVNENGNYLYVSTDE